VPRAPDTPDAAMLARARLFAAISPRARQDLAKGARLVVLGPGQRLWRQGAPANAVGVVVAGRCKLVREHAGREVFVGVAGPGDLVGTIGFTLASGYSSSVVCLRRARVLVVPATLLRGVLATESQMVAVLAADLAADVSRLMRMVQSLSAGSVQRRLASVLVDLADRAGEPFPGGVLIPLPLKRADLASLGATTVESASRAVSAWRRRGLLTPMPAGYLLHDLQALKAVASGE
jgi:CRP-like cAMP-binding protein